MKVAFTNMVQKMILNKIIEERYQGYSMHIISIDLFHRDLYQVSCEYFQYIFWKETRISGEM